MEDKNKIDRQLAWLNATYPPASWMRIDGNQTLNKVEGDISSGQNLKFFGSTGIIIITFLNKSTGEIKIFPANIFEMDKQ